MIGAYMGLITVSGPPGCRAEEVARLAAQRLEYRLVSESMLRRMIVDEYGGETAIPDRAYPAALVSLVARLAKEDPLVLSATGAEAIAAPFPSILRVGVSASARQRTGAMMLDHQMDRTSAVALLSGLETEQRSWRRRLFRRGAPSADEMDLTLDGGSFEPDQAARLVEEAARLRGLTSEPITEAQLAQIQFPARLVLARHGIVPADRAQLPRRPFANSSEQMFASLLDFYRIPWEYEPRSFPLHWDREGRVLESFTPDFYLPEFDLYIELTTMKQANVTRKNRKLKLLKQIHPHVNLRIFYQKDFQHLVFKHGLVDSLLPA